MWILTNKKYKKCSNSHFWRLKFKQHSQEPFVVCVRCNHAEKIHWYSDYQKQIVLEDFFK